MAGALSSHGCVLLVNLNSLRQATILQLSHHKGETDNSVYQDWLNIVMHLIIEFVRINRIVPPHIIYRYWCYAYKMDIVEATHVYWIWIMMSYHTVILYDLFWTRSANIFAHQPYFPKAIYMCGIEAGIYMHVHQPPLDIALRHQGATICGLCLRPHWEIYGVVSLNIMTFFICNQR